MEEYTGWFEARHGRANFNVTAASLDGAQFKLEEMHPDHVGSDGEITTPQGETHPIEWHGRWDAPIDMSNADLDPVKGAYLGG